MSLCFILNVCKAIMVTMVLGRVRYGCRQRGSQCLHGPDSKEVETGFHGGGCLFSQHDMRDHQHAASCHRSRRPKLAPRSWPAISTSMHSNLMQTGSPNVGRLASHHDMVVIPSNSSHGGRGPKAQAQACRVSTPCYFRLHGPHAYDVDC